MKKLSIVILLTSFALTACSEGKGYTQEQLDKALSQAIENERLRYDKQRKIDEEKMKITIEKEVEKKLAEIKSQEEYLAKKLYFSLGSTKDEVKEIMGTPDSANPTMWRYGNSSISFSLDGKVTGYDNRDKNLIVK